MVVVLVMVVLVVAAEQSLFVAFIASFLSLSLFSFASLLFDAVFCWSRQ